MNKLSNYSINSTNLALVDASLVEPINQLDRGTCLEQEEV